MSTYKVNDYINKKWTDILKETTTVKAYNLGIAIGLLECYKTLKQQTGKEIADTCFEIMLSGTDEFNTIFRTLVGLYNEESNSKAEALIEKIENYKKPNYTMSDEHRDLLEEFLEHLYKKERNK